MTDVEIKKAQRKRRMAIRKAAKEAGITVKDLKALPDFSQKFPPVGPQEEKKEAVA